MTLFAIAIWAYIIFEHKVNWKGVCMKPNTIYTNYDNEYYDDYTLEDILWLIG